MLKKNQILNGAVVEIYRIRDGLGGPAEGDEKDYVLITGEAGSVFDGGHGAKVGCRLEIVQGPKKRGGINTAIVKVLGEDREIQGHVFWCELRASCKLVQPSPDAPTTPAKPARKPSAKLKEFTEKQLTRLPKHGYWVVLYQGEPYDFICVKNGAVKYTRPGHDEWNTLMWTCCPTAKQIAAAKSKNTYEYFEDHASMLARFPDAEGGVCKPAPNDS